MMLRYWLWLCILLSQLSLIAQQEDYFVVTNSDSITTSKISVRQCNRFIQAATRRTVKLNAKVKKANDYYLGLYSRTEQKLLEQLCLKNEASANALIDDSWYRNNRFNNKCKREQNQKPNKYYPELDSLTRSVSQLEHLPIHVSDKKAANKEGCGCEGTAEFKKAKQSLEKEIKRSELISQYFKEQNQALASTLHSSPELSGLLKPMQGAQAYFGLQLKELQSLFGDRSLIESKLMGVLMNSIGGSGIPSSTIPTAGMQTAKPVELSDLLKDSPDLTKLKVQLIKENPEAMQVLKYQNELKDLKKVMPKSDSLTKDLDMDSLIKPAVLDSLKNQLSSSDSLDSTNQKKEKKDDKINPLKIKRWRDRMSFTNSFQPDQSTSFLPKGFTLNTQLMYQWTKKSNIGMGGNYFSSIVPVSAKVGENHTWNNRVVSGGYGYKIGMDLQLKAFLFLQGNYEVNFRNVLVNTHGLSSGREQLNACLLGLKFVYGAGTKKSTSEILYNFNHQSGQPAIVFRTGIQLVSKHRYQSK
jgi:hypothetical protein